MRTHLKLNMRLILVVASLIIVSPACSTPQGEGSEPISEEAVETKVAQTLAAQAVEVEPTEAVDTPLPSSTFTPQPTFTPSPPQPDIIYEGVSFAFDESLAISVNAEIVPGEGEPDNPWSKPDYIRFIFNGYPLSGSYLDPQILVFPVEAYRTVNPFVGEQLTAFQTLLEEQPSDPENIMVYHFFNAAQYFMAQEAYLSFQNGRGIRYITQYGQDAYPVGYPNMFYTFQGLTNDGSYYVSAILPLSHPSLPDPDAVPLDQGFYDRFQTYLEETKIQLNEQPAESFVPSLINLDAVIESLLVEWE